jgi:energy-coupling factor transport system ATP-binding protein
MENDCVPTAEMHERVHRVAKMVDMDEWENSSPYELSGGQKQRTSLAGVLIDDVDILLFDEPLANLDPATGKTAIEIIDDIHRQMQKTVLIIEHRLEDVLHRDVDRVIVINDGRIIADMNAHELVCSDVLAKSGIREPLYVTAMKYAGISLVPEMNPGYISSLELKGLEERLRAWNRSVTHPEKKAATPSILKVGGLNFSYDGVRPTLKDIDFDICEGEMVSVVGRNGAGKSTLAKLMCAFEKEDTGAILFSGENLKGKSIKERAEVIGFVMQNPNQMISKNLIFDEIALGLRLRRVPEEQVSERVEKVLKVCGLSPFIKWPISALSYGQKKRVTIASILVLNPRVLILDEPTAGQDYRHYTDIMEFLRELNALGISIILITHDMHLMLEYAPRAIVLSDGEMIADTRASVVLTNADIIEKANLKETSLYRLAQMVGIPDGTQFVQNFIDYERELAL